MPELKLGKQVDTDYGKRFRGVVEAEHGNIPITWRESLKHDRSEVVYVLATGWLGAKNSMRLPAHEAVRAGHVALTFDYTNKSIRKPIEQNVEDLVSVIDALPVDLKRRAIGLSMGGRVLTQALSRGETRVEAATMVASAGFIKHQVSVPEVIMHFAATYPESAEMIARHPIHSMHIGSTALNNCIKRNWAIIGEIHQLVNGKIHHLVDDVKQKPNAPHMRFMYGDTDRLLPSIAQSEGVQGLEFDQILAYRGGHLALVGDAKLSRLIFELDGQLSKPVTPPSLADLKLAA